MASSRELGHRLNEDGIGQLPDPLICGILSHLSIKDAVRTSSVSPKWKSHWLWVPSLELSSRQFPDFNGFKTFGDKFFDTSRTSSIHEIILDIHGDGNDEEDTSYLTSWIDAAVKRKVQHLDVERHLNEYLCEIPISLYTCKTLVCLKLSRAKMADAEFVSFPCLTTMDLKHILYPNEATFEKLVSSCPVLDFLNVVVAGNDAKSYRVHSRSLRKFFFMRGSPVQVDFVSEVVVDAPLLCRLSIYDNVSNTIEIKNLESNASLGISLDFGMHEASVASWRSRVRSFLPGISRVRYMSVETDAFKLINDYAIIEPRLQLPNVSCMAVTICEADLKGLPTFLRSCPKLKYLIVGLDVYEEMPSEEIDRITFSSIVPECLLSSLKFVDIKTDISRCAECAPEMKLVKYFIENAAILKKVTLHVNHSSVDDDIDIAKELLKIPRRSATCQIVVN